MRSTAGHRIKCGGVPPFGDPGITVRLSTPPGLSQIPTSFIGSRCQGIHRAPLETSTQKKPQRAHTHATCVHTPTRKLDPPRTRTTAPPRGAGRPARQEEIARCSRPLYSSQTTTPTTCTHAAGRPHGTGRREPAPPANRGAQGVLPQDPTVCQGPHPPENPARDLFQPTAHRARGRTGATGRTRGTGHESVDVPPMSTRRETNAPAAGRCSPRRRHGPCGPPPARGAAP